MKERKKGERERGKENRGEMRREGRREKIVTKFYRTRD